VGIIAAGRKARLDGSAWSADQDWIADEHGLGRSVSDLISSDRDAQICFKT
jgi:hypothetical protein